MDYFLKARFIVGKTVSVARVFFEPAEFWSENFGQDERLCNQKPGVEVQSRENSFESICQEGSLCAASTLFLASSESQVLTDANSLGCAYEMLCAYKMSFEFGELTFVVIRKATEQFQAGHEAKYSVSDEFHLLVVGAGPLAFTSVRAVRQRLLQQGTIGEFVTKLGFERVEIVRCHTRGHPWSTGDLHFEVGLVGLNGLWLRRSRSRSTGYRFDRIRGQLLETILLVGCQA